MATNSITYNNNNNWVVPGHIGTIQIEVWGAGGGGGANNRTGNNGAGGGGGGAYSRSNLSQLTSANLTILVGAGGANGNNNNTGGTGGTSGFNNNQVEAVGGSGGTLAGVGGANGLASGGVGQVGFNGGNGAGKVATGIGGGGGSSGGNAAVGRVGQGQVGGGNGTDSANLPAGAGAGGNGGGSNANGSNGVAPGGGAGGAGNNTATPAKHGGTGAIGQITLTWTTGPVWMEAGTASTQDFTLFVATSNTLGQHGFTGTAGTGTLTSVTQPIYGSVRSIQVATGASNGSAGVYAVGVIADTGTRGSFGFRFSGTPAPGLNGSSVQTAGTVISVLANNNLQAVTYAIGLTTGNKLVLMDGLGNQLAIGTHVLAQNTDYRISFAYTLTNLTTINNYVLYLNGNQELSATNVTINGAVGNDTIAFDSGDTGWTSGSNLTFNYAHIYIDNNTTGDVGDVRVTAKRPLANGTTNQFTGTGTPNPSFGTGNARYVNYRPLQTATAQVAVTVSASSQTEEYNIEGKASGDVNIDAYTQLGYTGWIYAKASVADTTPSLLVNNIQAPISLTTSAAGYSGTNGDAVYPLGTGTDIGLITGTTAATVTMYDAGIEIAYLAIGQASWTDNNVSQPIFYDTAMGVGV